MVAPDMSGQSTTLDKGFQYPSDLLRPSSYTYIQNVSAAEIYNTNTSCQGPWGNTSWMRRTIVASNERISVTVGHCSIYMLFRLLQRNVHVPIQTRQNACGRHISQRLRQHSLTCRTSVVHTRSQTNDDLFAYHTFQEFCRRSRRAW